MGFVPGRQPRLVLSAPAALFALLAILLWAAPVAAQTAAAPATGPPSSPTASDQDIDQLTAVLGDAAARDKLMAQLRALKAARTSGSPAPAQEAAAPVVEPRGLGATLVAAMGTKLKQLGDGLSAGVQMLSRLPEVGRSLAAEAADPTVRAG